MKNLLFLLFTFCQVVVYGQFDSLKIHKPHGPDYSKTIYPKDDGRTYNQYVGETIAGYTLVDGWRKDTINGGFNKEIYKNPYVSSQGEYVGFNKESYDTNFVFYRYRDGKKYSGKILDTLDINYTPPVARGMLYGKPYYESKGIKIIFQADYVNGLIQGVGTISVLSSKELISHCHFENGEIVGETVIRGIYSNNIYKKNYEKGNSKIISQTETDKDGNKISPIDNVDKFSFKATYLTLLDPYRFLDRKEKAKEVYRNNTNPNFQNPLLIEPVDLILYYFSHIGMQEPLKKYNTKHFEISEFIYDDLKVVFYSFNQSFRKNYAWVIECYDKLDRLIIVRYQNVYFNEVNNLDYSDYINFYGIVGYGNILTTFMYDDNGNIIKASKYKGVYENDINFMCDYDSDDFMKKILSYPSFKPISIINPNEVKISDNKD
ncbi:hypothetical protein [Flavobacterium sp. '19STA2R22 D10 B1']|uniref:hypothetical protein n=1 Tax=Flavobacterium aerium TaxID=3037261 RepID=UPI00278C58C6|nr:hypothetical protein [Flavobacterium sp. '19STA2R22 D10 B1']